MRKVFQRFTPVAQRLLDELDTLLGPTKHCFAVMTSLDLLCQKTACKNSKVADQLLEWTLHGYLLSASVDCFLPSCFVLFELPCVACLSFVLQPCLRREAWR